jgi:Fe2+ transport system protein FeoA
MARIGWRERKGGCGRGLGVMGANILAVAQYSIATQSQALLLSRPSVPMSLSASQPCLTLACAKVGERLRVVTICPECPECMRLRELGFQDRVEVRKVSDGAAIICSIMGMRVAIGRSLGEHVRVEKIAA